MRQVTFNMFPVFHLKDAQLWRFQKNIQETHVCKGPKLPQLNLCWGGQVTFERKSTHRLLMRKCFRQIQSTLLPGWFLKNQQVPLLCASFLLKNNNKTTKKGISRLQEEKKYFTALGDVNMKCTFSNVIKAKRHQLEPRNPSIRTFSETCKLGTSWWQWGLLTQWNTQETSLNAISWVILGKMQREIINISKKTKKWWKR